MSTEPFGVDLDVPLSKQSHSSFSWKGCVVFGSSESIKAVRDAVHAESIVPALRREIERERARNSRTTAPNPLSERQT